MRKKAEICYRQFFTDRDWAVQSHAVNNCTSCLPTANILFSKLVLPLSKKLWAITKHFQSWIINWAHKYWLIDKCIVIDTKLFVNVLDSLCRRREPLHSPLNEVPSWQSPINITPVWKAKPAAFPPHVQNSHFNCVHMTMRFGTVLRFSDPARVLCLSFNKLWGLRRFGLLTVVRGRVGSQWDASRAKKKLFISIKVNLPEKRGW